MKLHSGSALSSALVLIGFLIQSVTSIERHYYIAAVNIQWDYTGNQRLGPSYKKAVFREYESGFTQAKTHPTWSGLLGPTIHGQEGDTIVVTFRNMADQLCSIHPHGIAYGKQSEGSLYFDNTSQFEKEDDVIYPGREHTYYWEVTPEVAPKAGDPACITYTYFSHNDLVKDYNTGLIGPLLICKKDSLDDSGKQIHFHQELVLLFGVFDESNTWYSNEGPSLKPSVRYTINGYTNGSIPDLSVCAHSKVTWHLLGMSSKSELFSVHFNGQVLQQAGHKVSSIGIISGTATSAEMSAIYSGRWLFSSHISKHLEAGMYGFLDIKTCEDFPAPKRRLTIQQKRESQEWTYYIAAEESIWDYAPQMPDDVDGDFRSTYLRQSAERIGKQYKKAVFTQYTNESFTERAEVKQRKKELGILGPVIRAQIRDVIKIVFKNKASRPYSIYPHGLSIDKEAEGANYPEGGNQSHAVQPGETYTYVWRVIEEDEPLDGDSRCLTRMYHSAVDVPRDIASGLVGPLLICKSQSLSTRNVQLRADKEQHAMFAVFDENKSWYLSENINTYCGEPKKVKTDDPEFYNSNIMHTINGYVYESGQELGFCNGEIVTWHVSSVGEQDDIETVTFYGHTFELNDREEDILKLFPMTGETISMDMSNIGVWLLASLNTHETRKGLRVKFKDVECFRDVMEGETEYHDDIETYNVWKPEEEKEATKKVADTKLTQPTYDEETDNYADMLGLRTLRNDGAVTDEVEQLDLSLLDSDEGVLLEDRKPSLTGKSQNWTHAGLDDDNNLTSKALQNESTTMASLQTTLTSSTNSGIPVSTTNATHDSRNTIPTQQPLTSPLEGRDENAPGTQALGLSTLQVEEEGDTSDSGVFIYNVPTLKSPLNITEVQELEDFVLLGTGEETEKTKSKHLVEYNMPLPPHNTTPLEPLDNATGGNNRELNATQVTSEPTWEEIIGLNSAKVNSVSMLEELPSLNTTQAPSGVTLEGRKALNASHVDSEFGLEGLKELKSADMDSGPSENIPYMESTLDGDKESNITLEDAESSLDGVKESTITLEDADSTLDGVKESTITLEDADSTLDGVKESTITLEDADSTLDGVKESTITLADADSTLDGVNKSNITLEDAESSLDGVKELNITLEDAESSLDGVKESNITLEDAESSLDGVKELNITLEDAESSLDGVKESNITQEEAESSLDGVKESNITIEDAESTLNGPKGLIVTLEDAESSLDGIKESNLTLEDSLTDHDQTETRPQAGKLWNSTEKSSSESLESISISDAISNQTSTKSNSSRADVPAERSSSEEDEDISEESREEVVIYLKNSSLTEVILTSPVDPQGQNWTYEGKHELVPLAFPEDMNKYITDTPPKKKKKKVILQRVTPKKGFGMKTKKRKEYKPQPRSAVSPAFSPRGFSPLQISPRTTKPRVNEEDMLGKHIVIGVARNDFNDYDIYFPNQEQELSFENIPDNTEEYEFVVYKDPYRKPGVVNKVVLDEASRYSLQMAGSKARVYFITAEEVTWDYAGYGHRREDKTSRKDRHTVFKKVLFRQYLDTSFTTPHTRGELDEHLGILGPVIKAEVDETIYVVFKNLASRPYSLHANGVSYAKNMEGLQYEDDSPYYYEYDNAVQPNQTFTYMWTVNSKVGPLKDESDCRIWTYYSGVNPERDINSGLIGPLLVCRKGTVDRNPVDTRDFMLLFMMFDENKSWYYEKNVEAIKKANKHAVIDPDFNNHLKFHAINGIIYSLKGLRMYANQMVNWHLINMGSPKDFHSVHFHGQTFLKKHKSDQRHGVYPLLPGDFATLEMWPSKPGLWLLESEVGMAQQRGMQTLFLVLDNVCNLPLGLTSGTVKDSQITASDYRDPWLPSLARLYNMGKHNAWSTDKSVQWIQVDFQRPVVISKIATQGAKQFLKSHFVVNYTISYSTDRKKWIFYKGDSNTSRKTFVGNKEAHEVKENIFFPPIISRFLRLHPSHSYNYPTLRMELYGCELDGCSVPLGMQSELIKDHQITASSVATNWFSAAWQPWFARLDKQGAINAWQAKPNDVNPWLQIELPVVKKITAIITQGAKTLGKEMFVTAFVLEYSDDGMKWTKYTDDENYELKTFVGNSDNNGHMKNYIYPPIFSRFIRILPLRWQNSITMRVELLGCDFE